MYVRYVCTHVCSYVRMYVCEAIGTVQDRMDSSQFSKLMRVRVRMYVCTSLMRVCMALTHTH
jgi:hypothetical protein